MADDRYEAKKEIYETLRICNFCISSVGISLTDENSKQLRGRLKTNFALFITFTFLVGISVGQYSNVIHQMMTLDVIEGLIGSNLHTCGYGLMSLGKMVTLWYKRHKFRQLVNELADIWPVSIKDKEEANIKRESLSGLRNSQILYTFWNGIGVWIFNLSPIVIFLYHRARGAPSQLGYVYQLLYPFDKTKPIYHEIAYAFEVCSGSLCVCCMLGTDLLFMTMSSHIGMLLRLLQVKIRNLVDDNNTLNLEPIDCYKDIVAVVKIHQRLIHYHNDLEEAFSVANLINVLISSVNICCCAFNIVYKIIFLLLFITACTKLLSKRATNDIIIKTYLNEFLDPWVEMSNKFFLGAALTQMGIVCWYADDMFRASMGVSDAVYESAWYRSDVRCRRALLVVLQRSQKPLYFTAMKFSAISMSTYRSVLTNSYSYFTLLYTSYKRKN